MLGYALRMTYSIIARDPHTREMGVATQSQAFAVGSSVSWARPGAGVIATQSIGEPMYGELGLDLMRSGLTAPEALDALRSIDPSPERRQVAMVDCCGKLAAYTGDSCVAQAGHRVGAHSVALGNMLADSAIWTRMVEVFENSTGSLALRLVEALKAAQSLGGDIRGQRSAALLVVQAERSGRPWRDNVVDLRVDDHPEPVSELERMTRYSVRYHAAYRAFELALDGQAAAGLDLLDGSVSAAHDEPELALLHASVLAKAGRINEARRLLGQLASDAPTFLDTAHRFAAANLVDPGLFKELLPET